ncbi:MAG: hypothetical protein E6J05_02615 [Chloroflexi bacterium]|nr:MAG: hypothetical protein E6J05_02615 [Chloroflexota bacterium]
MNRTSSRIRCDSCNTADQVRLAA